MRNVIEIKHLQLFGITNAPPRFYVLAIGSVPTTGYHGAELSAHYYVGRPADGVQDFTFLAKDPTGGSLDVISDVAFWGEVKANIDDVKGVRVHASLNKSEALFKDATMVDMTIVNDKATTQGDGSIPWLSAAAELAGGGGTPFFGIRVSGIFNLMPPNRIVHIGASLDFPQGGWSAWFERLPDDDNLPGLFRVELKLKPGIGATIPTTISAKRLSEAVPADVAYAQIEVTYAGKVIALEVIRWVH